MTEMTGLREALANLDVRRAMRLTFNHCPECNAVLVHGHWLRWCENRLTGCPGYIGPLKTAPPPEQYQYAFEYAVETGPSVLGIVDAVERMSRA